MKNYIPLRSILNQVPKAILREDTPDNLLSFALDGYRLLDHPSQKEDKVKVFEIDNHKVVLPSEIKGINLVTYLCKNPSEQEIEDLCNGTCECEREAEGYETTTNNICRYSINYKLFLDSQYYNNNYTPLKYIGNTNKSNICSGCLNRYCTHVNETFSVDKDKVLWTSIQSGYLCIDYFTEIVDDDGDIYIVDEQEIKQFLSYYTQLKHWEERLSVHEKGATYNINRLTQLVDVWYIKSRGKLNLINADDNLMSEIAFTQTRNQKLMRLPALYYNQYDTEY